MKTEKQEQPISIGDIIETINDPVVIGEVINILENKRQTVELIVFDQRLKPLQKYDGDFKIKKVRLKDCKHFDFKKIRKHTTFEIGDIIQKTYLSDWKRYGIIVGFLHPDGILTSSYYSGYNGIDFLECVEIAKRGLTRCRNADNSLKRFSTSKENCIICRVDPWSKSGLRLIVGEQII